MTYYLGASAAEGFGNRHEDFPNNDAKDMALWNNSMGRIIGNWARAGHPADVFAYVDNWAMEFIWMGANRQMNPGNF